MLHTAVYYGHTECVRSLLKFKAAPNVKNKYNQTALQEGRDQGNPDVIALLDAWDKMSNVRLTVKTRDGAGFGTKSKVCRIMEHIKACGAGCRVR